MHREHIVFPLELAGHQEEGHFRLVPWQTSSRLPPSLVIVSLLCVLLYGTASPCPMVKNRISHMQRLCVLVCLGWLIWYWFGFGEVLPRRSLVFFSLYKHKQTSECVSCAQMRLGMSVLLPLNLLTCVWWRTEPGRQTHTCWGWQVLRVGGRRTPCYAPFLANLSCCERERFRRRLKRSRFICGSMQMSLKVHSLKI